MLKKIMLISTLALSLILMGCSSKKTQQMEDTAVQVVDDATNSDGLKLELNGDSDSMSAGGLNTVYFGYNSSTLSSTTRDLLDANATYLQSNPTVDVQVEGHADERGGVQYNLALGEKRARNVKDYLVSMGVAKNRITTISYGKERPVSFGHDGSSWDKNRRGNFVITAK